MLRLLNFNVIPMPWTEVYNALKTGVVDAFDTPVSIAETLKFYEVTRYLTLTHHMMTAEPVIIREAIWKRMTPETQKIVLEEAKKAQAFQREIAAKVDEEAVAKLKKFGMVVRTIDTAPLSAAMASIYQEFSAKPGCAGLIDKVQAVR
jgi:TRAP-type C4-dicarboxylate transport system substrate-binding protein